jgi:hypothetical protein
VCQQPAVVHPDVPRGVAAGLSFDVGPHAAAGDVEGGDIKGALLADLRLDVAGARLQRREPAGHVCERVGERQPCTAARSGQGTLDDLLELLLVASRVAEVRCLLRSWEAL